MSEVLRLEYACTNAEKQEVETLYLRKQEGVGSKWLTRIMLYCLGPGALWALYYHVSQDFSSGHSRFVFVAIIIGTFIFMFWKNRRRSDTTETVVMEISEGAITVFGRDSKLATPWSVFTGFVESQNLFVLMDQQRGLALGVPKRAFPDVNRQNWFRELTNRRPHVVEPAPSDAPVSAQSSPRDEIVLSFRLGYRDYLDRTLASCRTKGIILAIAGMVLGISLYAATKPAPNAVYSNTQVFVMFILPMLCVMSVVVVLVISLSNWRSHTGYLIPQQVTFSEKSMHIVSRYEDSDFPWTIYTHYKETRRSFILWNSHNSQWYLLPKTAFDTNQDREGCGALLARNLRLSRWFWG